MDPRPRSQSVMQIRPPTAPSRASRILQKVTNFKGRIRFTSRKAAATAGSKDDRDINHPYPPHSRSMDGPGVKPYMSHPMLAMGNMLVEPFVRGAGDGEDSSSQSASPTGSEYRRSVGTAESGEQASPVARGGPHHSRGRSVDGLLTGPDSPCHSQPTRSKATAPTLSTTTATRNSRGPSIDGLPVGAAPPSPMHHYKTHYPHPHSHANPTPGMTAPTTATTKHRPTPSIVISNAPEPEPEPSTLEPHNDKPRSSFGAAKMAKPKIDTSSMGLSPARMFTRKASRSRLKDAAPSPHPNAIHGVTGPPELPPPLPTSSPTPTPTPTPSPAVAPPLSYRSASESAATSTSMPQPTRRDTAPRLTLPTHSYRFSLTLPTQDGTAGAARLSPSIILRPPPLPIRNLPTLAAPPSSSGSGANPTSSGARAGLREMPELPRGGVRKQEEDEGEGEGEGEDDVDDTDDTEGRSSSALSQFGVESDMDGEERPRPSFSSSGSYDSRASSYMRLDEQLLSLPGPDTSRIDLSFLEHPPPSLPSKGKGKGRQDADEDEEGDMDTSRTPTSTAPYGDYFSSRTRSSGSGSGLGSRQDTRVLSRRTDSLQRGQGGAGAAGGNMGGAGQRTPRPEDTLGRRQAFPGPLQASLSLSQRGERVVGTPVPMPMPTRPGMYNLASRSLIDIHAVERRERVEMMLRTEQDAAEEEERRRRRSVRVSQVQLGMQVLRAAEEKDRDRDRDRGAATSAAMHDIHEDGDRDKETHKDKDVVGEEEESGQPLSSPTDMPTPVATHKRLSKAPPYEAIVSHGLRRRRSMPTFTESTDPPPYPAFLGRAHAPPAVQPRDDEGRERLPAYSNGVYMRGIVPRKMEFTAAGVQARDRKWRRVLCVVEGTALKIYRCPAGAAGVSVFGEWWERKVGVGDVSVPLYAGSGAGGAGGAGAGAAEEGRERVPKPGESGGDQTELVVRPSTPPTPSRTQPLLSGEHPYVPGQPPTPARTPPHPQPHPPATRSRLNLAVLLRPSKQQHGHSTSDVSQGQPRPRSSSRPSLNIPGSASGRSSLSGRPGTPATSVSESTQSHLSATSPSPSPSSSSYQQGPQHDEPDPADLIRAYTMQNAESGLGNDYLKRRNVIRVRAEDEQFLLQARDVPDVVAWIEALQASANIALDLDERLMPKGPLFPRRRRRRNRRPATDTVTQPSTAETSRPGTADVTNVALTTGI